VNILGYIRKHKFPHWLLSKSKLIFYSTMGKCLRLYQEKLSFSKLVVAIFLMLKILTGVATPKFEKAYS